jgi:hypothetical protein
MRTSLNRVLDVLRTATNERFREPALVRGSLQQPKRMTRPRG